MKSQLWKSVTILMVLVTALVYFSCSEDSITDPNQDSDVGTLMVRLTDAPFPIDAVQEANVTITRIELRNAAQETGSPFITLSEDTMTFNLLELQNDVTADLVQLDIPVGSYDLVRLIVSKAEIVLVDGTVFDMKVPSGSQTGIKVFIKPSVDVVGGLTSELLLDFDLSKSFVVKGNPGTPAGINGFNFKPVIRAVNMSTAGKIVGTVTDDSSTLLANAEVQVVQDSVVSTTFTDDNGFYALIGILEGTYTVRATKADHDTVTVESLEVVAANQSEQDFQLIPNQ